MSDIGVIVSLDDQSIEQSKVVLDYTSRDFTAIRSQLIGLAQGLMPDWKTVGESSDFGTLLIELFSYMGDVLNFYIDRTASEAFLGTAVRRQSVLYIADMLGYTPIGQQAASVKLFFAQDAEADETITIPKGYAGPQRDERRREPDRLRDEPGCHSGPWCQPDVPVFATEGVQVRGAFLGVSRGVPNTEFVLPEKGVVYNSVSVVSQEAYQVVNWTYVTDLANARPTQAVFTTYIDEDTFTHLVFGDNSSGRIPPVNCQIYRELPLRRGGSRQRPRRRLADHPRGHPRRGHLDGRQVHEPGSSRGWHGPRVRSTRCATRSPASASRLSAGRSPSTTTPTSRCRYPAWPRAWPTAPCTRPCTYASHHRRARPTPTT